MSQICRRWLFIAICTISFIYYTILATLPSDKSIRHEADLKLSLNPASLNQLINNNISTELSQLQCKKFFENDSNSKFNYIKEYVKKRIQLQDTFKRKDLEDCNEIRKRWNFIERPLSDAEREFPIAFARTVFRDYTLLEQMLSVEYQPQNVYCYALDVKADKRFKSKVRRLSTCFDNVIVVGDEFSVESNGRNVTRSHFACLNELRKFIQETPWKYAILLQNHDIPLKTNREIVEILKIFNGTNDVSTMKTMVASIDTSLNWTFAHIQLYKNATENKPLYYEADGETLRKLRHTKSLVVVELSRRAVEFLLDKVALDRFVDELEKARFGMDEVVVSTLNSNLPDMPGGFTHRCLYEENLPISNIGRYTVWARNVGQCKSGKFRHLSCVFGVEDLQHLASKKKTQLYFNKMMPGFDYGALHCWFNRLKERSSRGLIEIDEHFYRNLPHVRYNAFSAANQTEKFICS